MLLCGASFAENSFLETDFVRILIEEDAATSENEVTLFLKLSTPKDFLTCPATGDCPTRSETETKHSDGFFVNLKPKEAKILDLSLVITTEEPKKKDLWGGGMFAENPVRNAGYVIERLGESTFSTDSKAPLAKLLTDSYRQESNGPTNARVLYIRLHSIRYSRTSEKSFPFLELLAELGGWTSGVFGAIGLLVSWGDRLHRRMQERKQRKRHQKEEQLEELEMKERSSSDDHFSQVNPQANSANIKKNPV